MNAPFSATALINPFALPTQATQATLADVVEQVSSSDLSPTRKRDCLSALRRVSQLLNQDPSSIAAHVRSLRETLAGLNPASHGLSAHTWSNLRSNLFRAIEVSGLQPVLRTAKVPLSQPWQELHEHLPDRRTRNGLSRFMRFCSLNGITPEQVSPSVLQAFGDAVRGSTFARKAATVERDVATLWDRLVDKGGTGMVLQRLDLPSRRPAPERVLWADLSESFQADVEHLVWAAGTDPFAPDPRSRPLSPGSVRLRRQYIQSAVTALIGSGTPIGHIKSLEDLVHARGVQEHPAPAAHRGRQQGERLQ